MPLDINRQDMYLPYKVVIQFSKAQGEGTAMKSQCVQLYLTSLGPGNENAGLYYIVVATR